MTIVKDYQNKKPYFYTIKINLYNDRFNKIYCSG